MSSVWSGAFEAGDHWAVWRGAVGDSRLHRHLAAQAVVAPAPATVIDAVGRRATGHVILIDPLVPHRLEPADEAEIMFIEPTIASLPLQITRSWLTAAPTPPVVVARAVAGRDDWTWTRVLDAPLPPRPMLTRLQPALAEIDRLLPLGAVPLEAAAATTGLSAERFRHLFVDAMGLPFRRYVLWRRIGRAAQALKAGDDATTAAHGAGFADAAHFSRTLRAMFGIAPSALRLPRPPARRSRYVHAGPPGEA
jgi:AraC-like DNA-binding protein